MQESVNSFEEMSLSSQNEHFPIASENAVSNYRSNIMFWIRDFQKEESQLLILKCPQWIYSWAMLSLFPYFGKSGSLSQDTHGRA